MQFWGEFVENKVFMVLAVFIACAVLSWSRKIQYYKNWYIISNVVILFTTILIMSFCLKSSSPNTGFKPLADEYW